jgi:hypothetical protein
MQNLSCCRIINLKFMLALPHVINNLRESKVKVKVKVKLPLRLTMHYLGVAV